MSRTPLLTGAALLLLIAAGVAHAAITARELRTADAAARNAQARATALDRRVETAVEPTERARWRALALAARVAAAEAELVAGRRRAGAIGERLAIRRAELTRGEGPIVGLLAALLSIERRPALLALAQPGSIADLVHVQAVLAATVPTVRERTGALRAEVARTRSLQANAAAAALRLETGRARLVEARAQLAAVQDDDERALAVGEAARETVESLAAIGDEQAVLADLIALPGPPMDRPVRAAPRRYRLPVQGRLVTGLGEVSRDGVRARGLTLAVAAGAAAVAPAAGRVNYARRFRSYGWVVIIDHGGGWSTAVTGLGATGVVRGATISAGAAIGRAPDVEGARVTIELRRQDRPMDIAQLIG